MHTGEKREATPKLRLINSAKMAGLKWSKKISKSTNQTAKLRTIIEPRKCEHWWHVLDFPPRLRSLHDLFQRVWVKSIIYLSCSDCCADSVALLNFHFLPVFSWLEAMNFWADTFGSADSPITIASLTLPPYFELVDDGLKIAAPASPSYITKPHLTVIVTLQAIALWLHWSCSSMHPLR